MNKQLASLRRAYITGFITCVVLTMAAYTIVSNNLYAAHPHSRAYVFGIIAVLAITQLFVQMYYFLHVGQEARPRWRLTAALFAGLIVFILVGGSIWIMTSLNYRMTPQQIDNYMNSQDGL